MKDGLKKKKNRLVLKCTKFGREFAGNGWGEGGTTWLKRVEDLIVTYHKNTYLFATVIFNTGDLGNTVMKEWGDPWKSLITKAW